jgi:hypothetical protein
LSDIRRDVLSSGRIVCAISLDGNAIDAQYEESIAEESVENFGGLIIETADPKTLCLATLEEVAHHILPIVEESARISELIDSGKEVQALGRIVPCMEVWGAIVKAVHDIAQLMDVDMDDIASEDESLSQSLRSLVDLLHNIKSAMDAHDMVTIRDAMKHEMTAFAKRVSTQLEALTSLVAAK